LMSLRGALRARVTRLITHGVTEALMA
jgi:hypothetical protein